MQAHSSVVIVGRVNVGKSSLFNRLSTSVKSLTFDYAGVTRDFMRDTVCWGKKCFDIVDTGGISFKKSSDDLTEAARKVAVAAVESADLLIFVVDGTVGLINEDRDIARMLHKLAKPVIVVVNKIDVKHAFEQMGEFERLGFGPPLGVSCQHATGIGELLNELVAALPQKKEDVPELKSAFKVVLLGKPNVGKSSLLNALLKKERSIVSEQPGTTREAISEHVVFYQEDIQITDTPGIRKKRSVKEPLESMMVKSSLRALESADIVLLLVDSSQGQLSDQELKLAFYAFSELHKALIILFNKQDLVDESLRKVLGYQLQPYDHLIKKVERLDISCKSGKNIGKIMPLVHKVWERYLQELSASDLTISCQGALTHRPLYHNTQLLKLFRVRQVKQAPPTLLLIVNQPAWFGPAQLGFFDTILRKKYDLKGVPIKFLPRVS